MIPYDFGLLDVRRKVVLEDVLLVDMSSTSQGTIDKPPGQTKRAETKACATLAQIYIDLQRLSVHIFCGSYRKGI